MPSQDGSAARNHNIPTPAPGTSDLPAQPVPGTGSLGSAEPDADPPGRVLPRARWRLAEVVPGPREHGESLALSRW